MRQLQSDNEAIYKVNKYGVHSSVGRVEDCGSLGRGFEPH